MPRNGSGTFSLVSGNPVVTGTTIESNWANTTLSDIATAMTDSLSRSGQGGMTAALRIADGTQGAPGVGFANETGSGFYRAGTGEVWAVVQGAQTLNLDANGVYVPADKTTTVDGAFVFNEAGADKDARFEGDTDANLLFTDASTDRVGIGTATPGAKLDVVGAAAISGNLTVDTNTLFVDATNNRVGVGTVTPAVSLDVTGGISIQSANNLTWGGAYGATTPAISASAGFLSFYPNGSTSGEQMRLTSTSLGLGTSSPTFGSGSGVEIERAGIATLRLENSSASNSFELYADSAANGINLRGRDSSPMLFWTANTERARITSGGDFGLGTTAPLARLTVSDSTVTNGTMTLGNNASFHGKFEYTFSTGELRISQVGGGSLGTTFYTGGSERLRIPNAGGVQAVTTISVGNATPAASGAGITFPATQSASSDANTLDDYEEGTWTPTAVNVTGVTSTSGSYTKIGRVVCVQGRLSTGTSISCTAGSGYLSGLPFTVTTVGATGGTHTVSSAVATGQIVAYGGSALVYLPTLSSVGTQDFSVTYFV